MKTFTIPVTWMMSGQVIVEAENLEQAKELALKSPLPAGDYVPSSEVIDEDGIEFYNPKS